MYDQTAPKEKKKKKEEELPADCCLWCGLTAAGPCDVLCTSPHLHHAACCGGLLCSVRTDALCITGGSCCLLGCCWLLSNPMERMVGW